MDMHFRFSARQIGWYIALTVPIAVILLFWWQNVHPTTLFRAGNLWSTLGDLMGLLGAYSILLQLVLMARITPLEKAFGFIDLNTFHQWNGYAAYSLVLGHISLLTLGYAITYKATLIEQFLSFVFTFPDVLKAAVAVVLLTALIVTSVVIVRRKLPYESWYLVHLMAYLVVLLAFGHQLSVGTSFVGQPLFVKFWWALYLIVFFLLVWFRAGRLLYLLARHRFQVERVEVDGDHIVSVYIGGHDLQSFSFQPGQFALWRVLNWRMWWQAHPFSFSQAMDGKNLRITVKDLGDFTSQVQRLKPGDYVLVDGPHGNFTAKRRQGDSILLIAGGVGITPLRAMLDNLLAEARSVVLIYSVKRVQEVAFRDELMHFVAKGLHLHLVYTEDGPEKRISPALLQSFVPDIASREVFVCGPEGMMRFILSQLLQLGVPKPRIYTEAFAF